MTNKLENLVEEHPTVTNVVKALTFPLHGLHYAVKDSVSGTVDLKNKKDKLLFGATLAASAPVYTLIHEGMHAATAKLFGAYNFEVGLSELFGGEIIQKVWPELRTDAKFLDGAFGRITWDVNNLTTFQNNLVSYTPYLLTLAGVYCLKQGIKNNNPVLKALGVANVFHLLGNLGTQGDLGQIAKTLIPDNGNSEFAIQLGATAILGALTYYAATKIVEGITTHFQRPSQE